MLRERKRNHVILDNLNTYKPKAGRDAPDAEEFVTQYHAYLCCGGRNILPQPGEEIFEGEVVGLVKPGDETVR